MNKAKFWLVQIALVAIVGLVLSSPALAGGVNNGHASDTGMENASVKAGGERNTPEGNNSDGGNSGNGGGKPQSGEVIDNSVCTSSDTSGCTAETCTGSWNDSTSTCSFF